jgi:phospholipid/cholesterol/gamma-HCH transport system permease protein
MGQIGSFMLFLYRMVINREALRVYFKRVIDECILIGINSLFLVTVVSVFIGAVTAVQTAYNLISPLIPLYVIGTIVRDMTILELAPTLTAVVFAGKVGSNIAGELGTMKITEQIDALEVMGINSVSYLVLPKIIAGLITYPMLVIIAAYLSFVGGFYAGTLAGLLTEEDYIYGIRDNFQPSNVAFALIKSYVFAFIIISISAFKGYQTQGGALEVGQSSTAAVTSSCIGVLLADFLLSQLLV